uniref:Transferase n=1 Tax=Dechloromonas aromatica (strain RCB) TaxID=159087 RepID=Q47GM6_DECAR
MSSDSSLHLVLAPVNEFVGNEEQLSLASWCRSHPSLTSAGVLPSPYLDLEDEIAAGKQAQQLYRTMLPPLADRLNALLSVAYELREWQVLAGPWLQMFINSSLDRYLRLKLAWNSIPGLQCAVLDERSCRPMGNTIDAAYALSTDRYNLQLMSELLRVMGKRLPEKSLPLPGKTPDVQPAPIKQRVLYLASRVLVRTVAAATDIVLLRDSYLPRRLEMKLATNSRGRILPWISPFKPLTVSAPDAALRQGLDNMPGPDDEVGRLITRLLPQELPVCLLEDFHRYRRAAEKEYPESVAALCSANAWHYDETFKHAAVGYLRKGAKLLAIQHGGNYGAQALMLAEDHETAIADDFFSWGWTREGTRAMVHPMPAGKLIGRHPQKADNAGQELLWVTTSASRYLVQYPYLPEHFERYLKWQSRFLYALAPEWKTRLRLRPHYEDNGWQLVQRLKAQEPGLQLEDWERPFPQSLAQCRLYICDHLSTTFLEALSARKPTLLFWDEKSNLLRPEAQPYYQRLRDAGILFHNPEAAAQAVQRAAHDVEAWWSKPERVAAVDSFCARYARSEQDALTVWREELDRACARRRVAG